jgi:DNA-binding NtrC family response regulator
MRRKFAVVLNTQGRLNAESVLACALLQHWSGEPTVSTHSAILVIDDEPLLRSAIARTLRRGGFEIVQAASGQEGLWAIDQHQFSCVITDLQMAGLGGHEFVRRCHRLAPTLPVVVLTSPEDSEHAAECLRGGAVDALCKPFSDADLRSVVRHAISVAKARRGTARAAS